MFTFYLEFPGTFMLSIVLHLFVFFFLIWLGFELIGHVKSIRKNYTQSFVQSTDVHVAPHSNRKYSIKTIQSIIQQVLGDEAYLKTH